MWNQKLELDRVQGFYQGTGPHDTAPVFAALDRSIGALMADSSKAIQSALAQVFSRLKYPNATERITELALNPKNDWEVRASALDALHALKSPQFNEAFESVLKSSSEQLHASALKLLARTEPQSERTIRFLREKLEKGTVLEKQTAWGLIGNIPAAEAERIGRLGLSQLYTGTLDSKLKLDVFEGVRSTKALSKQAATFEKSLGVHGAYQLSLEGGDTKRGEILFQISPLGQCLRCHQVEGQGRSIGPNLAGVGKRRDGDYLLRALIDPSADIDAADRMTEYTLAKESVVGTLLKEENGLLSVQQGDGSDSEAGKKQDP